MCDCDYPLISRITDRLIRKNSKTGLFRIRRYMDCIYHGPQSELMDVVEVDRSIVTARLIRTKPKETE